MPEWRRARCASLVTALCLLLAGAGAAVPDTDALARLRGDDSGAPVRVMRFLAPGSRAAWGRYLELSRAAVEGAGGTRVFGGRIDQLLVGGGELPYASLVIDAFPSRTACIEALAAPATEDAGALAGSALLAVQPPAASASWLLGLLNRLLALFRPRILETAPALPTEGPGPPIAPDAAQASRFLEDDPSSSLVMINLLRFRERAEPPAGDGEGGESGRAAYARYGRNTLPHLFRLGGRILMMGRPDGVLEGASPLLAGRWDQMALVFYPSRLHLRHMVSEPGYQEGLPHRAAGLEATVVMPITPWAEFDPARGARMP